MFFFALPICRRGAGESRSFGSVPRDSLRQVEKEEGREEEEEGGLKCGKSRVGGKPLQPITFPHRERQKKGYILPPVTRVVSYHNFSSATEWAQTCYFKKSDTKMCL